LHLRRGRFRCPALASAAGAGWQPVPRDRTLLGGDRSSVAPMTDRPSVVYVAPDKMGGVITSIANLIEYGPARALPSHVVLTRNVGDPDARSGGSLPADSVTTVEYALPDENLHAVMRRVADAVPRGSGVLVANDLLELATASVHDFGRAIVHVL